MREDSSVVVLREEHRLRMFGNTQLRRVFGRKYDGRAVRCRLSAGIVGSNLAERMDVRVCFRFAGSGPGDEPITLSEEPYRARVYLCV